jgi:transcriptional regulator with XRE-family HTH domain
MLTLKEHRKRAVVSTRELATKSHVSPATIWRIERGGVTNIRPATMRAIARALNVLPSSIDEFAGIIKENSGTTKAELADIHNVFDLAAQQGVNPVTDPKKLAGNFWPDDERAEDFAFAIHAWRREGNNDRKLG